MSNWNSEEKSRNFLFRTQNAEQRLVELEPKLGSNPNYSLEYDATLADFWVYNYLHGKVFLSSPAAFIAEMQQYLENEEIVAAGARRARDPDRFRHNWRELVLGLMREARL